MAVFGCLYDIPLFFTVQKMVVSSRHRLSVLIWGMDQYGIDFQSHMEECLFGDSQLCTFI